MNFQEIVELIQIQKKVLNQINSNISETNNTIFGLIDKMGASEFYQAFQMNGQGYFRMQPGYSGDWVNIAKANEARMMELQQQQNIQIKQLLELQANLMQILQQKMAYELKGREYAARNNSTLQQQIPQDTQQFENNANTGAQLDLSGYTTIPMQTYSQQPASNSSAVYQEENPHIKGI